MLRRMARLPASDDQPFSTRPLHLFRRPPSFVHPCSTCMLYFMYTTPILVYMKEWTVAEARRRFAQLLKEAEAEPQAVFNRDRLAGAVIGPREYEEFTRWKRAQGSIAQATQSLRELCESEGYVFEAPPRRDRESSVFSVGEE